MSKYYKTDASGNLVPVESQGNTANVEVIAADTTLTLDDSGKTFLLDNTTGEVITLPALATSNGWNAEFIVAAAFETDNWQIASAEGDNISGSIADMGSTVAVVTAAAVDFINFVASAETIGDRVRIIADASNSQWIVTGMCAANGGITATDPS